MDKDTDFAVRAAAMRRLRSSVDGNETIRADRDRDGAATSGRAASSKP